MTRCLNPYRFPRALLPASAALFAILLLAGGVIQKAQARGESDGRVLGVCADPYMLPFSNREQEGFENRIAELFAEKLNAELKYKFFPQRRGFIRNTLRSQKTDGTYACDLVIHVPENFELAATTEPYYTTTYMLVYAKGRGIPVVETPAEFAALVKDKGKSEFEIGLPDMGTAQQLWVLRNDMMDQIVPYQGMPGDPEHNPGEEMMHDIAEGKIDAAIVFGPSAGYYAKQLSDQADFVLLKMKDDPENPQMRFEISFAMAVRYGEEEWKQKVNELIEENRDEIYAILEEYGVPLLPLKAAPKSDDDD